MKPRGKPLPESRFWNDRQTASRLGRSSVWFSENYQRLRQLGFPPRDEVVGGFPKDRIDQWIDERAGVAKLDSEEAQMLTAIRSKTASQQHGTA